MLKLRICKAEMKKSICLLPLLVVLFPGYCLTIIPDPPILDCRLEFCAEPDCLNPIPANPSIGKCCRTCPSTEPPPTLVCPTIPPDTFGLCIERCSGDEDCPKGQLCCSNGCGHECRVGVSVEEVCKYNGQVYKPGDSFPSTDGCNTCFCSSGGVIGCTKIFCLQVCVKDGAKYEIGQQFPAGDGCNTCTCLAGGKIACTEIACPCPVKGQIFKQCASACPANCTDPTPICTRQCVARCECPAGEVIDEKKNQCVPVNQCPAATCEQGGVTYEIGDSFPAGDGCNTCGCIRPNVIVCTLIACSEPPTCPPDKPLVNCFVDPCMFASCPNHPGARCVADYCGGCNARFFIREEEVTDTCTCPVKGQIFKRCASACPANCTDPTPICTRQCVARCECPAGEVIDEKKNQCVPVNQCPGNCPPTCTADFCRNNRRAKCTIPGPREIPGCTGECQFTFCSACYFSSETRPLPGSCRTCGGPISSERCFRRWARCIWWADYREYGQTPAQEQTDENFRCYRYPCPLKG